MEFDIVTLDATYRGIERSLNTGDLLSGKAKTHYNELINYYFQYCDLMFNAKSISYDSTTYNILLKYYNEFKNHGVDCEMIVYDNFPLKDIFGYPIELLGIDVVYDYCESLLSDTNGICNVIKNHLNQFGLLRKIEDINIVISNSICGDNIWRPCWVYKVNV